jgi:hypothetical protein
MTGGADTLRGPGGTRHADVTPSVGAACDRDVADTQVGELSSNQCIVHYLTTLQPLKSRLCCSSAAPCANWEALCVGCLTVLLSKGCEKAGLAVAFLRHVDDARLRHVMQLAMHACRSMACQRMIVPCSNSRKTWPHNHFTPAGSCSKRHLGPLLPAPAPLSASASERQHQREHQRQLPAPADQHRHRQTCTGRPAPAELHRQSCTGRAAPAELRQQSCASRAAPAELRQQSCTSTSASCQRQLPAPAESANCCQLPAASVGTSCQRLLALVLQPRPA